MRVMSEEIFGPILPMIPYDSLVEALAYINRQMSGRSLFIGLGTIPRREIRSCAKRLRAAFHQRHAAAHRPGKALPFGGVGASRAGPLPR